MFDNERSEEIVNLAAKNEILLYNYYHLLSDMEGDFIDPSKGASDDIFTISYTSGTSGNSKGVLLTNGNFLSAAANTLTLAREMRIDNNDVYISYLPLAHVFDRLGVYIVLSKGG